MFAYACTSVHVRMYVLLYIYMCVCKYNKLMDICGSRYLGIACCTAAKFI